MCLENGVWMGYGNTIYRLSVRGGYGWHRLKNEKTGKGRVKTKKYQLNEEFW